MELNLADPGTQRCGGEHDGDLGMLMLASEEK
jgi:hypothetical protein